MSFDQILYQGDEGSYPYPYACPYPVHMHVPVPVSTPMDTVDDGSPQIIGYTVKTLHGTLSQYPVLWIVVGDNQFNYNAHFVNYRTNYEDHMTWADYCDLQARTGGFYQPHRHSTYY